MGAGRGRTRRVQASELGWGDELLQDEESQQERDERRAQEIRDSVEACRDSGTFSTPLLDYLRAHADELAKYD